MPLPFWDDFSFHEKAGDTLWASKHTVRITDGFAIRPPSIGAAVFDGLNASGDPYTIDLIASGFTDTLESRSIRLGDVVLANRDSAYLSFAYQWKGNGEAPDFSDYLQVDFKNDEGEWLPISLIRVPQNPDPTIFYDYIEKIDNEIYFHNDFQFRILRYGRMSGAFDTWAVDYVYLNEHRFATDLSFPDRSVSTAFTPLFGSYRAVPKAHYFGNELITTPSFVISTQKNESTPLDYFVRITATHFFESSSVSTTILLDSAEGTFLNAFSKTEIELANIPATGDLNLFDPAADSITLELESILTSSDNISIYEIPKKNNADYNDLIYAPIDFRSNDTVRTSYTINDYYAYDDGVAEYSVGLAQAGNEAAFGFTQLSDEPDTLTGAYIYFPKLAGQLSNIMDFLVYNDSDGQPNTLLAEEVVPVKRIGVDVFHKITLKNAVIVPKNFYIGWRQPNNATITIGLDRSADHTDKLFSNSNGTWINPSNVTGTVMIRPIFGKGNVTTSVATTEKEISIFPNPVQQSFTINQAAEVVHITTVNGQALSYTQQREADRTIVTLHQTSSGLAIVQLRVDGKLIARKIVLR